jgi:hypothetical protein
MKQHVQKVLHILPIYVRVDTYKKSGFTMLQIFENMPGSQEISKVES